jgi:hypothetical protein
VDHTQTNQLHEIGFIKLETAHMVQTKNNVILNCRSRRERGLRWIIHRLNQLHEIGFIKLLKLLIWFNRKISLF